MKFLSLFLIASMACVLAEKKYPQNNTTTYTFNVSKNGIESDAKTPFTGNEKNFVRFTEKPYQIKFSTIQFPSKDNLLITANTYQRDSLPIQILLCHQAGWSRGEYLYSAFSLTDLGFSCMAIDQRSGNGINGVNNETAKRAAKKHLPTSYLDAEQDIIAAIDYIYKTNGGKPILIIGSSYSSSLVLKIGKNNKKVKAIAAFSPGEYFKKIDLNKIIGNINKPVFATSSKKEAKSVTKLLSEIKEEYKTQFIPESAGAHGARVLWKDKPFHDEYWLAFKAFLNSIQ